MTDLLAHVRSHCGCCWGSRCAEGKCRAKLPSGRRACLKGTQYQTNHSLNGKLADCLVFSEYLSDNIVHVVELKGGAVDVKDAVEQLQGGATLVEGLLEDTHAVTFHPVLLCNTLRSIARKALDRERVRFRGRRYPVWQLRCGASLPQ